MDETTRDPREDISLIKSMLEKTTAGMKTVAPWFMGFGILWLCFGILTAVQRVAMMNLPPPGPSVLAQGGAILGWLFFGGIAAGFLICRRKQVRRGLDSMALKLIDIWGVCIVLFIALSLGLNFIPVVAVRLLGMDMERISTVGIACALIRSHLFFLLPMVPLLATAVFMENRRMLLVGAGLAAVAALFLGCQMPLYYAEDISVGTGWVVVWNVTVCLLDIAPGVMLLIFGRQLKRM